MRHNWCCNAQDNTAQHWWHRTFLAANTISNTGKIAKMVHLDFFGENGGRNPHHSDSENRLLQVVASDEGSCDQNGKQPTPPFPLSSTYYHYFHSLLTAFANVVPSNTLFHQHST